jgi:hypothetical protein
VIYGIRQVKKFSSSGSCVVAGVNRGGVVQMVLDSEARHHRYLAALESLFIY